LAIKKILILEREKKKERDEGSEGVAMTFSGAMCNLGDGGLER
jgi:hypothetical protein